MRKLSLKKELTIVRLYLSGLSYGEISAKAGVAKGNHPETRLGRTKR